MISFAKHSIITLFKEMYYMCYTQWS